MPLTVNYLADAVLTSFKMKLRSTYATLLWCVQRGDREDVPWVQRDPSEAYQILVAARQGRSPQRSVERLALLQLLIQLHRESHERTGTLTCIISMGF
jgi:hypothetical protein